MKRTIVLLSLMLFASTVWAQKAEAPAALKPEVALKIRTLQLDQSKAENEFTQLQDRIKILQEQYRTRQDLLNAALRSALKDSGLDEKKYILDGVTLAVTAVAVTPVEGKGTPPTPASAEPKKP